MYSQVPSSYRYSFQALGLDCSRLFVDVQLANHSYMIVAYLMINKLIDEDFVDTCTMGYHTVLW